MTNSMMNESDDFDIDMSKEKFLVALKRKIPAVFENAINDDSGETDSSSKVVNIKDRLNRHLVWVHSCVSLDTRISGSRAVFSGDDLTSQCFEGLDLRGVDFQNAILDNVSFVECNLRHSSFENSSRRNAVFVRCDLRGTGLVPPAGVEVVAGDDEGIRISDCRTSENE